MCAKSQNQPVENRHSSCLRACLVDGDAAQLSGARRIRRRSLLLSVVLQISFLAALILIPLLSKPPRIALANVMPLPPYYHIASSEHTTERPHHTTRTHPFAFCLTCPPVLATSHAQPTSSEHSNDNLTGADFIEGAGPECSECTGLAATAGPHPAIPEVPTPSIVHLTHIDPAMLIRRVEPIFPVLARQTGREGHVELHALIGTDGSVRSLQTLEGDPMFFQSALDAVRQWRYKPLLLNGHPVEIDTHITVIYKLNR
ncbi:MAG: periplasmic protein TonB [Acidobacteriaceae bacterium]|nr:periplasmic protein TonB [Acidobacteriaceae bacterium]